MTAKAARYKRGTYELRGRYPTAFLARIRYAERMPAMNLHVSDELLAELRAKAEAEGRSVDQLAEEALRRCLEDRSWQELLAYGRETGRASGYTEQDVPDLVKEWRRERRSR